MLDEVREAIVHHVKTIWPGRVLEPFVWALGPVNRSMPGFQVLRIAPAVSSDPWVYISCGAWRVGTRSGVRSEFFLLSPFESPSHVETLAMLANFHFNDSREVPVGSVVDIGRSWMDGASCDHLLVSMPYPIDSRFESLSLMDGRLVIRFLWLMPITRDEAVYARSDGVEALERRFELVGVDYLKRSRRSVV